MNIEECRHCPHHIQISEHHLRCHLVPVPRCEQVSPDNAAYYMSCFIVPDGICSRVRSDFSKTEQEPPLLMVSYHYCGQQSYWRVREMK